MRIFIIVLILAMTSLWMQFTQSAVYKCIDANKKVTFQSIPCPDKIRSEKLNLKILPGIKRQENILPEGDESKVQDGLKQDAEDNEKAMLRLNCEAFEDNYKFESEKYAQALKDRKVLEQKIIAECERDKKTYCRQSAAEIRKIDDELANVDMLRATPQGRRNLRRIRSEESEWERSEKLWKNIEDPEVNYRKEKRRLGCDAVFW